MITSPLTATVVTSPLTATVVTPPKPRPELEELLEAHGRSRYAAALLEAGYETIPDVATALDGDLVDDCGMKKPHARRLLAVCVEKSGVSLPPAGEIMIRASPSPPVTALGLARARSQLPGEPGRDNFRLEIDGRDIGREGNGAGNDGGEPVDMHPPAHSSQSAQLVGAIRRAATPQGPTWTVAATYSAVHPQRRRPTASPARWTGRRPPRSRRC